MSNSQQERDEAWVGDAVLELFARRWILENDGRMDGEKKSRFTSNHFLTCFGNPTSVEAEIGRIYERDGLEAAWQYIETEMLPTFLKQEAKANARKR